MAIGALIIGDEILSGKRADKHLAHLIATLGGRGLKLAWARYLGDEGDRLTATLAETFAGSDIVFSFGGIGATPDDHTRQAAAAALRRPLCAHPEAVREIEAQFGAAARPYRVLMGEFPEGAAIIPNPVNRVPGFSVGDHHFFPGFPQMAWPMLDWVLAQRYAALAAPPEDEAAIIVYDAGESMLLPLMQENVMRFPDLTLFSLPAFLPDGARRLELGVRGDPARLPAALAHLRDGVVALGFRWEAAPRAGARAAPG
jgi:molybdopterin-biosynthesis enzyme MoeA-like protein